MGFTLLEGMACGAPAICSRVGGMPEYVAHAESGFVFDELSELTGYIERLAAEPELVNALGAEARRRVESDYGFASAGAALKSIYDEMVAA
jgi:starch synthase